MARIGERFGDAQLTAFGRLGVGEALIRSGQTAEGMVLFFSARKLRRGPSEVEQFLVEIGRGADDDRVRSDGPGPALDVDRVPPASVARSVPAAV